MVLLVLVSALAHAAWNAILKRCKNPENAIVSMMMIAALCSCAVAFALHTETPPRAGILLSLLSGLLEACYFVTLARALSRAPLGSVYTIVRGGALVVVWPVSVFVLREEITLGHSAGTVLVLAGLMATGAGNRAPRVSHSLPAPRDNHDVELAASKLRSSGIAIAALCAVFVGGYHLAYKLALSSGGRPEAVVAISLSSAVLINGVTLGARRRTLALSALRAEPIRIIIGGILGSVGFLIFLFAMRTAGAGLVLTLRNTSILFAQVMAFALGERPSRLAIVGAVLVTGGAVLLAF